jgi:threonylcarbamoyladenosine tRNA methylthiotransferase MtaB
MKVYLDTIGCRLNQAEIEKYAAQFAANGHELVSSAADADLVVINTCTVTSEAGSDSRQKIRQAARAGHAQIITTGCLATIEPDTVKQLPNVVINVKNSEKDQLVQEVSEQLGLEFDHLVSKREIVPGSRKRTRAFIKAQDGCDNHCTFCITRVARGASRSMPMNEIIADIRAASDAGVKEAVLTGVQLGGWGKDLSPASNLGELVSTILKNTDLPRLRLSSLEPWDLEDGFFEIWRDQRVCRQFHLPLQSGSDQVLRRMGRKNTTESFMAIVEKARRVSPEIAVTTDILVGFPGETEKDFLDTMQFIEKIQFAGGHVFTFSPRPGTPAMNLPDQIDWKIKKERSRRLRILLEELKQKYERNFLGRTEAVLWEAAIPLENDMWRFTGWTDNYIKCIMLSNRNLHNKISDVHMETLTEDGFIVSEEK